MKKRMTLMVLAMAVFITAIGAVKYGQVKKAIKQHSSFQPPPEAVTTIVARQEQWPANVPLRSSSMSGWSCVAPFTWVS